MRRYIRFTGLAMLASLAAFSSNTYAQTLEERVEKLEKKVKKNKKSLNKKIERMADRFSIQGFMTAGLTTLDGDGVYPPEEITDELCFHCDSLVGVQMDFAMGENYGVTTQLLARGGSDEFVTGAEWGYFYYKPRSDMKLRVGRMRTPYYANSEFLDVGFAYTWARLPREVYNVPLSTFEGVDYNYQYNSGKFGFSGQLYLGSAVDSNERYNFKLTEAYGAIANVSYGPMSARLGYHTASTDLFYIGELGKAADALTALGISGVGKADEQVVYTSAALTYDDGSFYAQLEYSSIELEELFVPSNDNYSAIFGYKMGAWKPYVLFTKTEPNSTETGDRIVSQVGETVAALEPAIAALNSYDPSNPISVATVQAVLTGLSANDPSLAALAADLSGGGNAFAVAQVASGLQNQANSLTSLSTGLYRTNVYQQESYGAGLRYDLTPKSSLTFEAQQITGFGDDLASKGIFTDYTTRDDATIYSVVFNAVF